MYAKWVQSLSRSADPDQPVGQRRALGDAHAAVPAHRGVPLAGGAHGPRHAARRPRKRRCKMLDVYATFRPGVHGHAGDHAAKRRRASGFPARSNTYSIEAMMQDRKALQAGTSHFLGQNFSQGAGDQVPDRPRASESSPGPRRWGVSTRLIGGLIMTHGDDDGLMLPPRLAPQHVVILPIYRNDDESGQRCWRIARSCGPSWSPNTTTTSRCECFARRAGYCPGRQEMAARQAGRADDRRDRPARPGGRYADAARRD